MILVYSLLEENRDRLVALWVNQVRLESILYSRIPKMELKEIISTLYDAYLDFLVSKNKAKLLIALTYIVRLGVSRSFELNTILKIVFCLIPVLRVFLKEAENYHQAMDYLEKPIFGMIEFLIEIFRTQQEEAQPRKKINLSHHASWVIYRA